MVRSRSRQLRVGMWNSLMPCCTRLWGNCNALGERVWHSWHLEGWQLCSLDRLSCPGWFWIHPENSSKCSNYQSHITVNHHSLRRSRPKSTLVRGCCRWSGHSRRLIGLRLVWPRDNWEPIYRAIYRTSNISVEETMWIYPSGSRYINSLIINFIPQNMDKGRNSNPNLENSRQA